MGIQEKILTYLLVHGKAHNYKIARALKTDVMKVTKALSKLREKGKIETKSGSAILAKGKKPMTTKVRKRKKQPKVELKEEPKKETEEKPQAEVSEERTEEPEETEVSETTEKEVQETVGVETEEKKEEERVEGTVKFYNPNKGFGFIIGDDGKEYYVHESGLKEGITIEADDRVSFKVVQGDKGPKAEEVEKISQSEGFEK